jgi:hypothetical protein
MIIRFEFTNGETRLFDIKPYLDTDIFKELENKASMTDS